MMTGPLLTWIQKFAFQHFALEVLNLFTKAAIHTCFPIIASNGFIFRNDKINRHPRNSICLEYVETMSC